MRHYLHVLKDKLGVSSFPVRDIREHLRGAAEWLLRAQQATPDDGVAHCYDLKGHAWRASYPETTGYIIPTLYDYARHYSAPDCAAAAYRMAVWEAEIQLPDGGVRAGRMDAEAVAPTVFNTGQVLFGWARAYVESGDERMKTALERAADWLVAAQDDDGAWRKFASPFTTSKLNSYNTRTAFGLMRAYEVGKREAWRAAADRNVQWAIGRAAPNGWLPDNSLTMAPGGIALTHTIAYSIRGILEVGAALDRPAYVEHALRMAREVAGRQRPDGALPGYLAPDWGPAARWTCVTGNSQMAINWLRLARLAGEPALAEHARRANRFNMGIQDLQHRDPGVRGALKGSHPIDGHYMTWRYPNWAAKFFMDALMLEDLGGAADNIG
jgi:hypothetical protein